jgi:Fe2+ or Zn2+ uptake regulation protein
MTECPQCGLPYDTPALNIATVVHALQVLAAAKVISRLLTEFDGDYSAVDQARWDHLWALVDTEPFAR